MVPKPGAAGDAADGRAVNTEEPGDICGRAPCVQHGAHFGLLLMRELELLAVVAALSTC